MIAAVGYLMYTGIRETSTYYLTLEEFLPQKDALANAGVRVAGRVKSGSVDWNPKNLKLNFTMIGLDQNGQPVDYPEPGSGRTLSGRAARHVCRGAGCDRGRRVHARSRHTARHDRHDQLSVKV